ncbi:MAG: signal peptidase II, partial [Bdellovibrionales bacterium]|nr:signal peptidase II [Bdellovibrionales bacterium]
QGLPDGVREATLWGVSSVAVVVVLYFLFCEYYFNVWGKIALSLILGGAIGNAIDRASKGEVVDFLDFYLSQYHWPAFNVADSAICVGGGILLLLILFESKPKSVTRIP